MRGLRLLFLLPMSAWADSLAVTVPLERSSPELEDAKATAQALVGARKEPNAENKN